MARGLALAALCALFVALSSASPMPSDGDHHHPKRAFQYTKSANVKKIEDAEHWWNDAEADLARKLLLKDKEGVAKNVIFFLGDGMSVPTLTAARIYKGQLANSEYGGEEASLFMESFPNVGVSKTFCADSQVADSACSATAYLTGVKANIATIGVKPTVQRGDCKAQMDPTNQVASVLKWAQDMGKSTGVVTTTRITHASPAGTYAHIADRDWENDAMISQEGIDPETCDDIAEQLILNEPGKNINVILGGGRREFLPQTDLDPEANIGGRRGDGKNLIKTWQTQHPDGQYVWNRQQFEAIDASATDHLLGLFEYDHIKYALDSREDPSLANLTKKAIEILSKNDKGYFLFVEGGRIDHAHHDNQAQKSLMECLEFDEAIRTAAGITNEDDTLILVTADHAHVFSISGYPVRGNPLFGVADYSSEDGLPYPTLSYANGPGYRHASLNGGDRYDISRDEMYDPEYRQISTWPLDSETHGGDDVLIYSRGPFAHLLKGNVQQSYIPHVIGFTSCIGPGLNYTGCNSNP